MKVFPFEPDRKLINPSFEGYRLSSSSEHVPEYSSIPLVEGAFTNCGQLESNLQSLAYKMELNGLFRNPYSMYEAFYFDTGHALWRIELGEEEICERQLNCPNDISLTVLPSVVFLDGETVAIFRGSGNSIEVLSSTTKEIRFIKIPSDFTFDFITLSDAKAETDRIHFALCKIEKSSEGSKVKFVVIWLIWDMKSEECKVLETFTSICRPMIIKFDETGLLLGGSKEFMASEQSTIMEEVITKPFDFKWEQEKEYIYITFNSTSTDVNIEIRLDRVIILIDGVSVINEEPFELIKSDESTWSHSGTEYLITLHKAVEGIWPLLWTSQKTAARLEDVDSIDDSEVYSLVLVKHSTTDIEWKTSTVTYVGPFSSHLNPLCHSLLVGIQNGDDALVYSISDEGCVHSSSYDAMAFVQASKRDRRYVIFLDTCAVIISSSKYIFLYHKSATNRTEYSPQYLIELPNEELIIGWTTLGRNLLLILTISTCHIITLK